MKRVVIIGGGITGLAATHRILERSEGSHVDIEVILLEAGSQLGGIIQTRECDGFLLECGPDSFISEKPEAIDLIARLGLGTHLIETNENYRRSFIVRNGRLLPVPEGFHLLAPGQIWPFITSRVFSLRGKARMAMDLLLPRRNLNGVTGEADESLAQFVRRRLGREALERMAQPMVGGIYTADPEKLSLRATLPRFLEMEREHRSLIRALRKQSRSPTVREGYGLTGTSGARYSLFLSFDRGMQMLTDKLADTVKNSRLSSIQLNKRVESLERAATTNGSARWKVGIQNNGTLDADAVCLALPAYASGCLLREIDSQLTSELEGISYASSATINLAYKLEDIPHALDGFGFVVPFIEKRTVMACTFSSVKFAGRAPEGHVLLRAFAGGDLQPEIFELESDDLVSRVRADLRDLLGIERSPLFTEVSRWERSMPQYHVGHAERVRRIQDRVASHSRLTLAGNAYSGLGIPDCIRSGEAAADELMNRLRE